MNILTSKKMTEDTTEARDVAGIAFDRMRLAKAVLEGKKVDSFAAGIGGVRIPHTPEEAWVSFGEAEDALSTIAMKAVKAGDKQLLLDIMDNYADVTSTQELVSDAEDDAEDEV